MVAANYKRKYIYVFHFITIFTILLFLYCKYLLAFGTYDGVAVRTKLSELVYTANNAPPSTVLPYHHEMAYRPVELRPSHITFCCEKAATVDGETAIAVSEQIYNAMLDKYPEFMQKLAKYGMKMADIRNKDDDPTNFAGAGWKTTMKVNTKSEWNK